jgi:surface protein
MKSKLLLILITLFGVWQGICAQEPYAVLEGSTLVFKYDNNKPEGAFDIPWVYIPDWLYYDDSEGYEEILKAKYYISKVVFDKSFGNYHDLEIASNMFSCLSDVNEIIGLKYLNTENVTYMDCMFFECHSLTSIDLSNFNTRSVMDMRNMFQNCYNLTNLDLSNFDTQYVSDMCGMFTSCRSLSSIDLTNFNTENVVDMTHMFSYCSSLTNLDLSSFNTSNVVYMEYMFYNCSNLTNLDLSNFDTSNVEDMMGMFKECSSLKTIDLKGFDTENVTDMYEMFAECEELTTIYCNNDWYEENREMYDMFYNCYNLVGGYGTRYSSRNVDGKYAHPDVAGYPGYFTGIQTIGRTIIIKILDANSNDVTRDVDIIWYDANSNQIGTGEKINGVEDGSTIYYSVLLNESLGSIYREVNMQKITIESDTIICQLEEIGRIILEGRVSAPDIDRTSVTIDIKQLLNGKYERNYSAKTDEQGIFKVEVHDDDTYITLSGEGYFDATLHRDGFNGNGNIGTIPMNLVSGFAFLADITMSNAVATGQSEDVSVWSDGLNNIEFELYNVTKGSEITDFTVQNNSVIIKSGGVVGDQIRLTAKSKQIIFADATTTFNIAEGANIFSLALTELGGIDVAYASSSNSNTIGYLYGSDNILVAKGSYLGDTLSLRHLNSGSYTLVSMGGSTLLGNLSNLTDFSEVGLMEGIDYVTTSVIVKDGLLTESSINEVPRMNDTRFYYTSGDTYFYANKASQTVGNYLTLSAHLDFKPEYSDLADIVKLTIDIPEGCEIVENSVIANRQAVAHTINGNQLMMTLNKEQWQGQVRFCIIPVTNQTFTITAMASFDIEGNVVQPIGSAQFEAKALSLSAPKSTCNTSITINGTAIGHSEVSIYDNDVLIGKTYSKANGSWSASCELYKPFSHSFHDIYAKVTTKSGMELTSESQVVEYDKNAIIPQKVTMTYYNGWYHENKIVVFDLLEGTTTPASYPFYMGTDFTFLADFTRNDTTLIKDVNIKVLNSDGTVRTLPAIFDGKTNNWVATTKYSNSSKLPQNVKVEYVAIPTTVLYDKDMEEAMNTLINNMLIEVESAYQDCAIDFVAEDENSIFFTATTNGYETEEGFVITILDYNQIKAQYADEPSCHIENDTTDISFVVNTYDNHNSGIVVWDNLNMTAYEIKSDNTHASLAQQRKLIGNLMWAIYGVGVSVGEYYLRMPEFVNWKKTLESEYERRNKEFNDMVYLLYAQCPDGSYRIKDENTYKSLLKQIDQCSEGTQLYLKHFEDVINKQQLRLQQICGLKAVSSVLFSFGGEIIKGFGGLLSQSKGIIISNLGKALINSGISGLTGLFGHATGELLGYDMEHIDGQSVEPEKIISDWYFNYSKQITDKYIQTINNIKNSYSKCDKEKEDEEEKNDEPKDEKSDNDSNKNNDFPSKGTTPVIDPSGYVYEAVLSNRLEGVTTTCYEKVLKEDMYGDTYEETVVWNAEDYLQKNPLKTDALGFYSWDVPQGLWQVKYEKEGYETTYSDWLPVPPPQLDVNVGMKQSTPPTVKQMRGYESGITIEMSKYMRPATMSTENVTVTRNGMSVRGKVEMLNLEKEPYGDSEFVSKVKFIPETAFDAADEVIVTVHKDVESYCGINMESDYVQKVKIEAEIKGIVADSIISIPYQNAKDMQIVVLPKAAAIGKTLWVQSSSSMIASTNTNEVVLDENGSATITLNGELPGSAYLSFTIDDTDVSTKSKVKVITENDLVATPSASIKSGESVDAGTVLTLTCDTEGATIFYTLDGSCPCDEATRFKYESPIVLTTDVIVKAIAVKDDMYDSDVATFIYFMNDNNRIENIDYGIKIWPVITSSAIHIDLNDLTAESITIHSVNGVTMYSAANVKGQITISLDNYVDGMYIVSVKCKDCRLARKIFKVRKE